MPKNTLPFYPKTVGQIPSNCRIWAVVNQSFTYDSGYGSANRPDLDTKKFIDIVCFENEAQLEEWAISAVSRKEQFRVFRVQPVETEVRTIFKLVE